MCISGVFHFSAPIGYVLQLCKDRSGGGGGGVTWQCLFECVIYHLARGFFLRGHVAEW